jgi:hypothetical protein
MNLNVKKNCLSMWKKVDSIYFSFTRLVYIKNKFGENIIFRVRLTKYKGHKVTLSDGTIINKNDSLLKIHLHNAKLLGIVQEYESEVRKALFTYRSVKDSLPSIADYIQTHRYEHEIKGLIGITSLYKGCRKLGFEVYPIHNLYYKLFKRVSFFPIHVLSSIKFNKEMPQPVYLFMSKEGLLNKYKQGS